MGRRAPRLPHHLLTAATLLFVGPVFAAPLLRAAGWWPAAVVYALFAPICHQIAERSFHLLGHPLAVCHRCLGLYLGFAAGVVVLARHAAFRGWLLGRPRTIVWFALPLVLDVWSPGNTWFTRAATGVVAALPIGLLAAVAAEELPQSIRSVRERHAE